MHGLPCGGSCLAVQRSSTWGQAIDRFAQRDGGFPQRGNTLVADPEDIVPLKPHSRSDAEFLDLFLDVQLPTSYAGIRLVDPVAHRAPRTDSLAKVSGRPPVRNAGTGCAAAGRRVPKGKPSSAPAKVTRVAEHRDWIHMGHWSTLSAP